MLVMERMRQNLREFLERNRNDLSPQKQHVICLEIARGLRFLHTHTPPIVHKDLTDKNAMFGKDGLVKIGDLGQSRLKAINADYFSTAQPGAFMPPKAMQERETGYLLPRCAHAEGSHPADSLCGVWWALVETKRSFVAEGTSPNWRRSTL